MILIGESSLHRATAQFVLHYHHERNHQGLGNKIIRPEFAGFTAGVRSVVESGSADSCATTIEKLLEDAGARVFGHYGDKTRAKATVSVRTRRIMLQALPAAGQWAR